MTTGGQPAVDALAGVTVVEFGGYAAGPAIGKYLANFGARVIHVESFSRPDGFRLQYPPYKDDRVGINRSGCFAFFNDSKQGVSLDIKNASALRLIYRLVARTDIVVENMRPGVMVRLGLGYPELKVHNPSLVMLSTSNLGQTGPRATHPGFGSQLSSLSGFTEMIGVPGGPPFCLYGPYIDMIAVAYGGAAVLAALDRQRRTGEGAFIDLAQYEAGLQFLAPALLDYTVNGVSPTRNGNRDRVAVPHGSYRCRDCRWVALSCWDDAEWSRLAEAIGDPVLTDVALATSEGRRAHEADIDHHIADWARERDAAGVVSALRSANVHVAIVNTMQDLYEDPQLAARDAFQPFDHAELGPMRYRMVSYQLSETPGRVRSAAPRLGEHTEEVFKEWFGLSQSEYDAMSAEGVFA
jgi:crotonobetainyl-CoA:carnitine CoA-transferase CaiB-like acyl-CoA transferase